MKQRVAIGLAALSIAAWSCKQNTKTTPLGYNFTVLTPGDGKTVKPGEVIIVDMVIADQNDSAWYDNRPSDYPEMIKIADPSKMETERGITEVFRMVSKGDSIELKMRAKDVFLFMWRMDTPEGVDPESKFTYRIKCKDVLDEAGALAFSIQRDSIHAEKEKIRLAREAEEAKAAAEELEAYNKIQIGKDTVIIDNYLKSKNVKASRLPSGIRYIIKTKGEGKPPVEGDFIGMRYSGQFLDGTEFGSGDVVFTLNKHDVIAGWDQITAIMKKGTVLTAFIPSTLAYGRDGRPGHPGIAPDAILVYEMELTNFKKP
ncbi:MAG TPA: FKBP-type peptidyl-prolyl cis-trans isomerase [Cyclobacteriaceae bacterium]